MSPKVLEWEGRLVLPFHLQVVVISKVRRVLQLLLLQVTRLRRLLPRCINSSSNMVMVMVMVITISTISTTRRQ